MSEQPTVSNVLLELQVSDFEKVKEYYGNLRDFRIADPFGFYLRFTTYHNILDSKYAVK